MVYNYLRDWKIILYITANFLPYIYKLKFPGMWYGLYHRNITLCFLSAVCHFRKSHQQSNATHYNWVTNITYRHQLAYLAATCKYKNKGNLRLILTDLELMIFKLVKTHKMQGSHWILLINIVFIFHVIAIAYIKKCLWITIIRNQDYKLHVAVIYSEGCLFLLVYIDSLS